MRNATHFLKSHLFERPLQFFFDSILLNEENSNIINSLQPFKIVLHNENFSYEYNEFYEP